MATLTLLERRWASGVLFAMFPLRAKQETFAADFGLDETIQRFFRGIPLQASLGLRAALLLVVLAPLWLLGRFAFFSDLDAADRMRVLERLMKNKVYAIRQLVTAWKAVGGLLVVGHESLRVERERAHAKEHTYETVNRSSPARHGTP